MDIRHRIKSKLESIINSLWYPQTPTEHRCSQLFVRLMSPLTKLYRYIYRRRQSGFLLSPHTTISASTDILVIVVGNLTVGGTGKTPLVIALAEMFLDRQLRVGIISRGYGSRKRQNSYLVKTDDDAKEVGDEPLLMARSLPCPVVIDPQRLRATHYLKSLGKIDVILCDDGLQHLSLPRTVEIAVVDQMRSFGNRQMLPSGPLREPLERLHQVDFIVVNGDGKPVLSPMNKIDMALDNMYGMQLRPQHFRNLANGDVRIATEGCFNKVHAIAGIGNPQRFFQTLRQLKIDIIPHCFADHYPFDIIPEYNDNLPLIMTAKDGVKCLSLTSSKYWVLDVKATVESVFIDKILNLVRAQ